MSLHPTFQDKHIILVGTGRYQKNFRLQMNGTSFSIAYFSSDKHESKTNYLGNPRNN